MPAVCPQLYFGRLPNEKTAKSRMIHQPKINVKYGSETSVCEKYSRRKVRDHWSVAEKIRYM